MREDAPVRSVARAVDILFALVKGPQSLGEVTEEVHLSKATVHRLLASLFHGQLVVQDPSTGEYLLGPGCIVIADAVIRGVSGLGIMARPILKELHAQTLETVTLHVRAGGQRICVEELVSPHPVRYTAGVGSATPIHSGSAGKLLLAFTPDNERERLLDWLPLEALTESTITDRQTLEAELAEISTLGYAESHGERVAGSASISAPIFSSSGDVVAALSVLGPDSRITAERLDAIRPTLLDAARQISERLASSGVDSPA